MIMGEADKKGAHHMLSEDFCDRCGIRSCGAMDPALGVVKKDSVKNNVDGLSPEECVTICEAKWWVSNPR